MSMPRILFLCTGNACRSQMAEGWMRRLHGDRFEVYSAGVDPHGVDPRAVRVMDEAGVDIASHRPKHVEELAGADFDIVVTVCDGARERCPVFPARTRLLHRGFQDPPRMAADAGKEEEALATYRRVRDEIEAFVRDLPGILGADEREDRE